MKTDYTHCTLVVDRSASMADKAAEATNGIKVFQDEQFALPGEFTFTLAQFDIEYERIFAMTPLMQRGDLYPRWATSRTAPRRSCSSSSPMARRTPPPSTPWRRSRA